MTSAKLIEPKDANLPKYRKKFCVEIDLEDLDDNTLNGCIITMKNNKSFYMDFVDDILNIIERKE